MKTHLLLFIFILLCCCKNENKSHTHQEMLPPIPLSGVSLIILGTMQDAGSPHIACEKECCKALFLQPNPNRKVVALGLVDNTNEKTYLFEATPDITTQLKAMVRDDVKNTNALVDGIFLTHAHIGHYAGLMYLGKEATDAKSINVYAMPRMKHFLETNGPWDHLVLRNNINLIPLAHEETVNLTSSVNITPLLVPHRDEYSETVGYKIKGPNKTALFIPDIDKWDKWDKDIAELIKTVDYAFLDATFYSGTELNNRDISQIPHPFVIESLEKFSTLTDKDKSKIVFIHFNHTNPIINLESKAAKAVLAKGFNIATIHSVYDL